MEHKVSGRTVVNLEPRQVRELNSEEIALFASDISTVCDAIQNSLIAWVEKETKPIVERLIANMSAYTVIEDTQDCVVLCESETHTLHATVSAYGEKAIVSSDYTEKATAFAGDTEGHSYIFILDVKS